MSKKSQREALERKEQLLLESEQKFSQALTKYLRGFATYYRQDPPTEQALEIYALGLHHLSPTDLQHSFEESIRKCKFFPTVAEMLQCLQEWRDRQPMVGNAPELDFEKETPEQKANLKKIWDEEWQKIENLAKQKQLPGSKRSLRRK